MLVNQWQGSLVIQGLIKAHKVALIAFAMLARLCCFSKSRPWVALKVHTDMHVESWNVISIWLLTDELCSQPAN